MSGFSIDWLDLREDADRRARNSVLREQALGWLKGRPKDSRCVVSGPVVVDLGAGTGSTLRALALPGEMPMIWRLVDHDQTLLAEASRRHGSAQRIETCVADLSHIEGLPLDGARLVTASALFDLVSAEFLDAFAKVLQTQCQQSPVGIYAALNYDGSTHWTPAHPLDDIILRAFNQDQRKDKGFGPALGPEAGSAMHSLFKQAGFEVYSANSPWVLEGADQQLVTTLVDGIAGAVSGSAGVDASELQEWVRFRQAKVSSGTCIVGHTDLLALPV